MRNAMLMYTASIHLSRCSKTKCVSRVMYLTGINRCDVSTALLLYWRTVVRPFVRQLVDVSPGCICILCGTPSGLAVYVMFHWWPSGLAAVRCLIRSCNIYDLNLYCIGLMHMSCIVLRCTADTFYPSSNRKASSCCYPRRQHCICLGCVLCFAWLLPMAFSAHVMYFS